jgi:hypothetical protein
MCRDGERVRRGEQAVAGYGLSDRRAGAAEEKRGPGLKSEREAEGKQETLHGRGGNERLSSTWRLPSFRGGKSAERRKTTLDAREEVNGKGASTANGNMRDVDVTRNESSLLSRASSPFLGAGAGAVAAPAIKWAPRQ